MPTAQCTKNKSTYQAVWSEERDAYVVVERQQVSISRRAPFPLQAAQLGLQEYIGRQKGLTLAQSETQEDAVLPPLTHISTTAGCDVPFDPPAVEHITMAADEQDTDELHVETKELYITHGCLDQTNTASEPTSPKTPVEEPQSIEIEQTRQYLTERSLDFPSLQSPIFHHINYNGETVHYKSSTSPEVSLWAIMRANINSHANWELFPRKSVLTACAIKYVDPVLYGGAPKLLELQGSKLRDAVIGLTYKVYSPDGTWHQDVFGPDDDTVVMATADLDYWNASNRGELPRPFALEERGNQLPSFNPEKASNNHQVMSAPAMKGASLLRHFDLCDYGQEDSASAVEPLPDLLDADDSDNDGVSHGTSEKDSSQEHSPSGYESPPSPPISEADLENLLLPEECERCPAPANTSSGVNSDRSWTAASTIHSSGGEIKHKNPFTVCGASKQADVDENNPLNRDIVNPGEIVRKGSMGIPTSASKATQALHDVVNADSCRDIRRVRSNQIEKVEEPVEALKPSQESRVNFETGQVGYSGALGKALCFGAAAILIGASLYKHLRK